VLAPIPSASDSAAAVLNPGSSTTTFAYPAGYFLAGWSPPEPASASPADDQFEGDGIA
jgi:hypothetical protein